MSSSPSTGIDVRLQELQECLVLTVGSLQVAHVAVAFDVETAESSESAAQTVGHCGVLQQPLEEPVLD
ncbi:hypothetical protein Scep_022448 [Stephania cephalantha]|uniref:Uncharacterized protein n=1 Tax=Stephania cephalantha TaxID=152367 RepID=A0AAP0F668_9MAGN